MREKIHSYLGFARKSRNLVAGYNSCEEALKKGKVHLILLAGDLASNTNRKFEELTLERGIPLRIYKDREKMSEMIGLAGRGVLGITDENLAMAILQEIDRNEQGV